MKYCSLFLLLTVFLYACQSSPTEPVTITTNENSPSGKVVIYQVFTRLFGNTDTSWREWGSIEENGVGKLADFTDTALDSIKALGITHIWYTGIPHHALIRNYEQFGISNDDPDVVKGRAGSPYAVKDYYNINPDLAIDPSKRMDEFDSLVARTHRHGLKVIIDIVPNHVARRYQSLSKPDSVEDFGAADNRAVAYDRDNNFYYIPGESFQVPLFSDGYRPLGGEPHPLSDGKFDENPAKWTGNGSKLAQPEPGDWYETVKINYGVRPDGSYDFDRLPDSFATLPVDSHMAFWYSKRVPSSWKKFRDIAFFWLSHGVDGFRFDMAEMVPVEFWSYMNSAIKNRRPDALLVAEVYNPAQYRDYIRKGKMDYLYDKVGLYDTLKHIIQQRGYPDHLVQVQESVNDIEHHMLHFLENHDEQRIASPAFAGNPRKAFPAMVLSATISTSPTLIYFGQEVGEPGARNAGFGKTTRTSIFDYVGVPNHQRWMNNGKFDGAQLTQEEKQLREDYRMLLRFTVNSKALTGNYLQLQEFNRRNNVSYGQQLFAFARWKDDEQLIVVCNFSATDPYKGNLLIPNKLLQEWKLSPGKHAITDALQGEYTYTLESNDQQGSIDISLAPLESVILKLKN